MKPKNIHAGHRERMRIKFDEVGFQGWHDHEILEYMLYDIIPRKDTNVLAHALLQTSGNSIVKLLKNANEIDFEAVVDGAGEKTARFLTNLSAFVDVYREKLLCYKPIKLDENNIEEFIKSIDFPDDKEDMVVLCLDRNMRVKSIARVTEASGSTFAVAGLDKLIKALAKTRTSNMILVHNHPSGNDEISAEDINTTIHVEKLVESFGIFLIDHYILCGNKVVSVKIGRAKKLYGV